MPIGPIYLRLFFVAAAQRTSYASPTVWFPTNVPSQTRSFQALIGMVEDDRLAQSRQSELVRREKEATQAVKKLEADLFSERGDHFRQVKLTDQRTAKRLACGI